MPLKALGITAALALAACAAGGESVDIPADAVVRLSDQFSSDFALIDQNGQPRTDEDFRGEVALVYFGFATCPDVCPLALGTLSAALNELSEKERGQIVPLFITVDPERDTPQAMADYIAPFDAGIVGLTGTPEEIAAVEQLYRAYARKVATGEDEAEYTMDHSAILYLMGPDGGFITLFDSSDTPESMAVEISTDIKAGS
jgi:protein SCO1/2